MPTSARGYARVAGLAPLLALAGSVALGALVYVRHTQTIAMIGIGTTAVLMLALAIIHARRGFRRRAEVEAELRQAYDDLENRVTARTRELVEANARSAQCLRAEQAARADAEGANRLKADFLATVSHELRTPLNAIVGWAHLLRTDLAEDRGQALDAIERNAFAQARLIDDLLDVSSMIEGRLVLAIERSDMRDSVAAALETLKPAILAKQLHVLFTADGPAIVAGDAVRLQQVAWNLLSNAIKFTPQDGHVAVEVRETNHQVMLRVSDNGGGIAAPFLPHIFEPFRQGTAGAGRMGLGLGLAIVKRIVELHGGGITAESGGLAEGARFTVLLPLLEGDHDAESPKSAAMDPPVGADLPADVSLPQPSAHG